MSNEKQNGSGDFWKYFFLWVVVLPVSTLIKIIARQK